MGSKGERVVRMHCGVSEGECVTCSARRNRFYFAHPFLMLCLCFNVVSMCTCRDITMATSSTELLQTEGTVMLHILFSIKQDQDIGKELLEAVKVCTRQSVCFRVCHSMHVPLYVILSL